MKASRPPGSSRDTAINKNNMGRYATIEAPNGDSYEFKFWFAVQDSWIPWADTWKTWVVFDYDEDEEGLTEEQKTLWKSLEGEELSEEALNGYTQEEQDFLYDHTYVYGNAEDDSEDLDSYWDEIKEHAQELGVPIFRPQRHKDIMDSYEAYAEKMWEMPKTNKRHAELADLDLKTLLCCFLQKHGEYVAHYDI